MENIENEKLPIWKLGNIKFDEENSSITLTNYSWQTLTELFSTISMYIGLSLKEFMKDDSDGVPIWCFTEQNIISNERNEYSKEDVKKAKEYFKSEIEKVSKMFLDFTDSDEKQEDVDKMFDALKRIYLSLWKC